MKIEMIGKSPAFLRLLNAARMVAVTDVSVLLLGEPGSGKATLAHEIHATSLLPRAPFLAFTCTGAPQDGFRVFLENQAQAPATLYLREVTDLDAEDQARLLHLLTQRDGGAPRIIAASAHDLNDAVRQGRFRRDLYQRLCVVPLEIPPLRERVLDIAPLSEHFIALAAARHGLTPPWLKASAERLLRRYVWPGNLRELANVCERLAILLPGVGIEPENLPREILHGEPSGDLASAFALPPQGVDLNRLEAELIRQALSLAGGNKSRAARLLGLTRDTLLYRLQKHLIPG